MSENVKITKLKKVVSIGTIEEFSFNLCELRPISADYLDNDKIITLVNLDGVNCIYTINKSIDSNIIKKITFANRNITFIRYCGKGLLVGIDTLNREIIEFDNHLNVRRVQSYSQICKSPGFIDQYANGDIAMLDVEENKLCILSSEYELKYEYFLSKYGMKEPISISITNENGILICDEESHCIFELGNRGEINILYGKYNNPGTKDSQLAYPLYAEKLMNGNMLIVDSMNDRILEVNLNRKIVWKFCNDKEGFFKKNNLFEPNYARRNTIGDTLVVDKKNNRIIEIDVNKKVSTLIGNSNVLRRMFHYQRSVQRLDNDELLIADTGNNRVIQINKKYEVLWTYGNGKQSIEKGHLFWPRWAERLENGNTLIADGRNSRIIEVTQNKEIIRVIDKVKKNGEIKLHDPHYFKRLSEGILIVDSESNTVFEVNDNLDVIWSYDNLYDPHYADKDKNDNVIIADSGNNRIIIVDKQKNLVKEIKTIEYEKDLIKLSWPRVCRFIDDEKILFVDGGTGYIFIMNYKTNHIEECIISQGSLNQSLKYTRCIQFINKKLLIISDIESGILIEAEIVDK
ncbi:hypothetical protein PV797_14580 [Clostridiaceae bacterium M8S5]|nr:hypothetical protein PV797_14580 [Clostridiaceae bacterium M8S5]